MKEVILWILSFVSLFVSLFWLQVMYLKKKETYSNNYHPNVSILIPAHNEEKTITKTIKSVLKLDYPKDRLRIIVINDNSKDKTKEVAKKFKRVLVIDNKHKGIGKASALNYGLKFVNTELFAVLDADSEVSPDSLKKLVTLFKDKEVAAAISEIKVKNLHNTLTHIQRIEYILATFIRKLMSKIDTLHITPGVLSVYQTDIVKKLHNFDENNITEDLEIAMRLRYNNYKVEMHEDAITYTNVPFTFSKLWNQRIRWFRGFIQNNLKYKKMIMSKKHGLMGKFQMPLNAITFFTILLTFFLISYDLIKSLYRLITKFILLKSDILYTIKLPVLKEFLLSIDIKYLFPLAIALLLSFILLYLAHKNSKEKFLLNPALLIYFSVYPLIRLSHWITAIYKETIKTKRKW